MLIVLSYTIFNTKGGFRVKRLLACISASILLCSVCFAVAESSTPVNFEINSYLSTLSVDDFHEIRDSIDSILLEKGSFYLAISKGSTGVHVLNLQNRLSALHYLSSDPTGKWNSDTQKALKSFEKYNS